MHREIEVTKTRFDTLSQLIFGDDFVHEGRNYRKSHDRTDTFEAIRLGKLGGSIHPDEKDVVYVFRVNRAS